MASHQYHGMVSKEQAKLKVVDTVPTLQSYSPPGIDLTWPCSRYDSATAGHKAYAEENSKLSGAMLKESPHGILIPRVVDIRQLQ